MASDDLLARLKRFNDSTPAVLAKLQQDAEAQRLARELKARVIEVLGEGAKVGLSLAVASLAASVAEQ